MAKKRRKTEEKKEYFKKPEFDEVEFMQKEVGNTKVALLSIIFSIPIAVLAYLVTLAGLPVAAFLIGIGSIFLLKYVYQFFNIETDKFETKDWLGNGAMFFLTWLAIWVLILNMPFSDLTNPTIGKVRMLGCPGAGFEEITLDSKLDNPCTLQLNDTRDFTVTTTVTDNSDVQTVVIQFTSPAVESYPMTKGSGDSYSYTLPLSTGDNRTFHIFAEDVNGHTEASPTFTFSAVS
ncbi:MAG: hypothetical protein V3U51_05645 [Thermoplasmata archaeon]